MSDAKLTERGWTQEKVEPGNCVRQRWSREGSGVHAQITRDKDGHIEGVIKAVEDAAEAKRKGELVLRELQSLGEAATTLEGLLAVLEEEPPRVEPSGDLLASYA
jgi:hypothetical protein